MREYLERIARGLNLEFHDAYEIARAMLQGIDEAIAAAILMGLRVKGEEATEIAGFAKALRDHCIRIPLNDELRGKFIDTAGTGGDGIGTLNVSTAAALIAAYLGAYVVKHGNRSVSSTSGSADFIEALGFNINIPPDKAAEMVMKHRFTFAFAPAYHPAMKNVMPVRKKLGVRTIFNLVGPLANPALLTKQLLGVGDSSLIDKIANASSILNLDHVIIVHGEPGIDEVSVFGKTTIIEVRNGRIDKYVIEPRDLGLGLHKIDDVKVKNPTESVEMFRRAVKGIDKAARDFIVANTSFALYLAGLVHDPRDGAEVVTSSLNDDLWNYINTLAQVSRA